MNTQSDKNRKTKIITIFLGMFFILAGGGGLAGIRFGDGVVGPVTLFLFALCFSVIAAWSRKNQWAIIPAGAVTVIAILVNQERGRVGQTDALPAGTAVIVVAAAVDQVHAVVLHRAREDQAASRALGELDAVAREDLHHAAADRAEA